VAFTFVVCAVDFAFESQLPRPSCPSSVSEREPIVQRLAVKLQIVEVSAAAFAESFQNSKRAITSAADESANAASRSSLSISPFELQREARSGSRSSFRKRSLS